MKMKKLENDITDGMGLIENLAIEVENDLADNIEFEEDENVIEWVGSYELDKQIFDAFTEDAIVDYFEDYLSEEISIIESAYEYEVEGVVYIEDDCLVVRFANY